MSKDKSELKNQINEGVYDYELKKTLRKKNSLSKEEWDKCNIQLTEKQHDLYKGIRKNTLTVVHGPAGTSKTFTACYTALALLADKKVERIIITKPIQESGEEIGHLPGSLEDKVFPYKQSYYNTFCKIIGKKTTDFLFSTEEIKFEPLAYMRGSTYDDCVMLLDECFTAETKVVTQHKEGGRYNYIRLKDIVKSFKSGKNIKVSSWNEKTNKIEQKKIVYVFENGVKDIYEIKIENRKKVIKTTENHPFLTFSDGELIWENISNIKDNLILYKKEGTNNSTILTNDTYDIILGMILGDSSLLMNKQYKKSYRLLTNHSIKQQEYMEFKKSIFNGISSYRNGLKSGFTGEVQCGFQTKSINLSEEFISSCYDEFKNKYFSKNISRWFSERTLAIWYMDDGNLNKNSGCTSFSTHSMKEEEVNILSNILESKFNILSKVYKTKKGYIISLNKENSNKMFDIISDLVIDSMSYKMSIDNNFNEKKYQINYNNNLTTVGIDSKKISGKEEVYNIEVEDNNNYFVDNILVHNCQNASMKQLMLWSTRLGNESKAIMMGDTSQYDVRKRDSGYNDFIKMVSGMVGLNLFEFNNDDIVRNKFLIELTNRYDKYRSEGGI